MRDIFLGGAAVCVLSAGIAACTQGDVISEDYEGGVPQGAGVGQPCSTELACRTGLSCGTAGKCEPGHSVPVGQPCVITDECTKGLYCAPTHQCANAGTGELGAPCKAEADCIAGLRCGLVGFGAQCVAEGTGDLGTSCKTSVECLGGLVCAAGKCAESSPGVPPFGLPTWQGETCDTESGAPSAWFHVPRGNADDKDFYRLPFPNDVRTKNGHPDLTGHPTPGAGLLGFDVVDRYLRAIEKENDGFGAYPTVLFRFNTGLDFGSFQNTANAVQFIDVTANDPAFGGWRGLGWYAATDRGKYICGNWLGVRPAQGDPLTPGHTYAVILSTAGKDANGGNLARGEDFASMLASTAPAEAALAAAHAAYKPLRDWITAKSIDPATILTAAVFTVGHVRNTAEKLAPSLQAAAAPTATQWVRCGSGTPSPCPDATGDRACDATADPAFDELHALVSLPIFQSGTAPYTTPGEGLIDASGGTIPVVRTEDVCLSLTVPKSAMPAAGWPLAIYAHGTGGSFRSHVHEGLAKSLASAAAGGGVTVPFAVLGIDQVEHGPRRGDSTDSPNNLFFDFANPQAARDNVLQGAADQLSLGRLASTLDLAPADSPTGAEIKFDPAGILFWGHSQGATEGSIGVAFSQEIKGAVLSGQGASLMDSLLGKTRPVNIAAAVPFALEDFDTKGALSGGAYNPILSLLQTYIDPADPLNFGVVIAQVPPTGVSGHHVFQPYGLGDSYAPPATEQTYALAAHLGLAPPDPSAAPPDAIGQLTPTAGGVSKNVGGSLTAVVREYGPAPTYDGHFVAFQNPAAQADVASFLGQIALGNAPTIGGP